MNWLKRRLYLLRADKNQRRVYRVMDMFYGPAHCFGQGGYTSRWEERTGYPDLISKEEAASVVAEWDRKRAENWGW